MTIDAVFMEGSDSREIILEFSGPQQDIREWVKATTAKYNPGCVGIVLQGLRIQAKSPKVYITAEYSGEKGTAYVTLDNSLEENNRIAIELLESVDRRDHLVIFEYLKLRDGEGRLTADQMTQYDAYRNMLGLK